MAHWNDKDVVLCLSGGLLLGVTASTRMVLFGKVTGSSGLLGKTVNPLEDFQTDDRLYAAAFNAGLVAGGGICSQILPDAFESWEGMPWSMFIIAGLLVGFGSQLGNGCTSGHGICGISSFRVRSLVATCTFMTTGVVTAVVANTSSYQPYFENTLPYDAAFGCLGVALFLLVALLGVGRHLKVSGGIDATKGPEPGDVRSFRAVAEVITGLAFATGLAVSNMTRISATISFLDVRYWNPALMFVMAGAIMVTATSYFFAFKEERPWLGQSFALSKLSEIDAPLVVGAALFGIGWGLMGACPAPAITNLASAAAFPRTLIYLVCLVGGMYLNVGFQYIRTRDPAKMVAADDPSTVSLKT